MLRPIDDAEPAVPDNGLEGVLTQSGACGQSVSSRWINPGHRSYGYERGPGLRWSGRPKPSLISVFRSPVRLTGTGTLGAVMPLRETA